MAPRMRISTLGGHADHAHVFVEVGWKARETDIEPGGHLHLSDAMFGANRSSNSGRMELGCEAVLQG